MRRHLLVIGFLGVLATSACKREAGSTSAAGELLLRYHFAGTERLLRDTNAVTLRKVYDQSVSSGLHQQILQRFSHAPFLLLSNYLAKGTSAEPALFQPLIEDLLRAESFVEVRAPAKQVPEIVLAINLNEQRARLWESNLRQVVKNWQLGNAENLQIEGATGWETKRRQPPHLLRVIRKNDWLFVGLGPNQLPLQSNFVARASATQRPLPALQGYWFSGESDLRHFQGGLPSLKGFELPTAQVTMSNHTDNVRTAVRLSYAKSHGWKHERWQIPTNVVREPLVSFTVAQGFKPWLDGRPELKQLQLAQAPNQYTMWALSSAPFQTFLAAPIRDASNQLQRVRTGLPGFLTNTLHTSLGTIRWDTNSHKARWIGLPFVVPSLGAARPRNDFLVAELFPPVAFTNPAPAEVYAQVLGRTNLIYYDWEITENRLNDWRNLYQLTDIITSRTVLTTNAPTQAWLLKIAPLLGNSATELTANSPTELRLVRKSPVGFTGFELASFTRWLDSPRFPRFGLATPPLPKYREPSPRRK